MRLYRALLRLYPAGFRAEYGEEMCAIFAARRRDARGLFGALLWMAVIWDTIRNALPAHVDLLGQDLRYTLRGFRRTPGFALTVVLVSALGVGATTAVFTVTDHVLIRPLPFSDPDRLVRLWEKRSGYSTMELSPPNYRDWKNMSTAFEGMAAYHPMAANLVGEGEPERLEGVSVTAGLFPLLGVQPALGRLFSAEDDREGASGTLLISYGLWQANFGADRGVIGRKVLLDSLPYVIVGVLPASFYFPNREAEIWVPIRFSARDYGDRTNNMLNVIAKLRAGVTLEQAREELNVLAAQLERAYPIENRRTGATVMTLREDISSRARLLLTALFGAAICVLLIACTNVANLMLARAMARQRELAVRTALGAGRERLLRQLLTESLMLALLGGVCGVLAGAAALPLLLRLVPQTMPIAAPSIDVRVLLFALLLTALTGLAFGVVPAVRACRNSGTDGLREGARAGGGRKERLRSALVIVEVTVSVVLVISAGLLIRALWRLQAVDPGFRADGVLTLRTALPMPKYRMTARREQFYRQVLSEVRGLPGVSGAAYISYLPMTMRGGIWPVGIGARVLDRAESNTASLRFVTPGFFTTLGIPIRQGRDVSETDRPGSPAVAVVSESFVRRYWPGENPIGRRFDFAFQERIIVGVAGDIRVRGLERNSEPQVYLSSQQVEDGRLAGYAPKDLVVRSSLAPTALLPSLRRIIRDADPEQPVSDVRTMPEIVAADVGPRTAQVRVLGAFALIAFVLAGIGIHGLLAFAVSQRTQEIGVRMALGAQARDILGMVLREGAVLAAAGIVIGVPVAYLAGRSMEALLAGVRPADLPTFLTAALLAVAMTVAGSLLPAIRAVRVDPATVIRAE